MAIMKIFLKTFLIVISASVNIFSQSFTLQPLCTDLKQETFAARLFNNEIYIVSYELDSLDLLKGQRNFTDILVLRDCILEEANLFSSKHQVDLPISSLSNDGPISTSENGDYLFFSNNSDFQLGYQMGIFYLTKLDSGWSESINFPFNSPEYSCMHPFYDEPTQKLYFSSNMDKENSSYSIYSVDFDGFNFGQPQAVTPLNSSYNDLFPSTYEDKIYFTSDRNGGFGGLDIYVYANDSLSILPSPINSEFDDLAYYQINDYNAFISSNRTSLGEADQTYFVRIKREKTILDPLTNAQKINEVSFYSSVNNAFSFFKKDFKEEGLSTSSLTRTKESNIESSFVNSENGDELPNSKNINTKKTIYITANQFVDNISQLQDEIDASDMTINQQVEFFLDELETILFNEDISKIKQKITLEEEIRSLLVKLNNPISVQEREILMNELTTKLMDYDPELADKLLSKVNEIKKSLQLREESAMLLKENNEAVKDLLIIALRQEAKENDMSLEEFAKQNKQRITELGLSEIDVTSHLVGKKALQQIVENTDVVTFLFSFNSYNVKSNYKEAILDLIKLTQLLDGIEIQIEGHTDISGSPVYNMLLSERRALAIKKQLEKNGLEGDNFKVKFFGINKPKYDNLTKKGRILNRRVEVKLILKMPENQMN